MENPHGRWFGSLELGFERAGARTILRRSRHVGPLRVQRPFWEPDGGCQVYILNPPGGVVGGDELRLHGSLEVGSQALFTTPGATKLYRSAGPWARTRQHFVVREGARLEWLPQETIVFDGANAEVSTRIDLEGDARAVAMEVVCLGRPSAGERFLKGHFIQRFELFRDQVPLWLERTELTADDPTLQARWGLSGQPVFGTLLLHPVAPGALAIARQSLAGDAGPLALLAATALDDGRGAATLVCRYLGPSATKARTAFSNVWQLLRPSEFGSPSCPPRIWAT